MRSSQTVLNMKRIRVSEAGLSAPSSSPPPVFTVLPAASALALLSPTETIRLTVPAVTVSTTAGSLGEGALYVTTACVRGARLSEASPPLAFA